MNTTHKAIFSLFLATFLALTPNLVRAQVVDTPATSAQVEEMKSALIALLTQLIAQLQEQINTLLAQQATQATQLGAVEQKVDNVVVQTAPVVVPAPVAVTPKIDSFCVGGYKSGSENTLNFKSNVPIDVSKTEIWIDGTKRDISILSDQPRYGGTEVTISPSVYTFAQDHDGDGESTLESFQVKLTTSDGKVLASTPVRYRLSTWNALCAEYFKVQ